MIACAGFLLTAPAWSRSWTDDKGRKVEAEFAGIQGTTVQLKLPNGKIAPVPFAQLSQEDQTFAVEQDLRANGADSSQTSRDRTPDYTKAVTRPHPPLDQRIWPETLELGRNLPTPVKEPAPKKGPVRYRMGRFQFETDADPGVEAIREAGQNFTRFEELFQQLPWDLAPVPAENNLFQVRLFAPAGNTKKGPPPRRCVYNIRDKRFYADLVMLTQTSSTLTRELVNMMMDPVLHVLPIWAAEGAVEYLEAIPVRTGTLHLSELPDAIGPYVVAMREKQSRLNTGLPNKPSVKGLLTALRMSHKSWSDSLTEGQVMLPPPPGSSVPAFEPPAPVDPAVSTAPTRGHCPGIPDRIDALPQPYQRFDTTYRERTPEMYNAISAVQTHLRMHSCLLFYYFLHLDNASPRGDPMLTFLDKTSDFAAQIRMYEQAVAEYHKLFAQYQKAWVKFSQLPGVTVAGGTLSHPGHLKPPQPPVPPRAPLDATTLPDEDLTLAHQAILIRGRSDEELGEAFRKGFATLGIDLL